MGVSEVLLCPYRCLEYKMERLEKLKIQLCFYSRFLIILFFCIIGFVAVLTFAVFICRRFDLAFLSPFGVAVLTCRRYDLSPF